MTKILRASFLTRLTYAARRTTQYQSQNLFRNTKKFPSLCSRLTMAQNVKANAPPFLCPKLPDKKLLSLIENTSKYAKESGFLISFESKFEMIDEKNNETKKILSFQSRLALNLNKKPKRESIESKPNDNKNSTSKDKKNRKKRKDPFLPPFDDGAHVCELDKNYNLLLNKYNVVDNHILITSKEFIEQSNLLISNDFDIILKVIESMNGLAFYNGGRFAGASQKHKHIQIVPKNMINKNSTNDNDNGKGKDKDKNSKELRWPIDLFVKELDLSEMSKDSIVDKNNTGIKLYNFKEYPFIHCVYLTNNESDNGNKLHCAYGVMIETMTAQVKEWFGKNENDSENENENKNDDKDRFSDYLKSNNGNLSYNLLVGENFMLIAARQFEEYVLKDIQISVNALGFAGSFFCKTETNLKHLKHVGPTNVLSKVSFPLKNNKNSQVNSNL